jgi:hypothetical protein
LQLLTLRWLSIQRKPNFGKGNESESWLGPSRRVGLCQHWHAENVALSVLPPACLPTHPVIPFAP